MLKLAAFELVQLAVFDLDVETRCKCLVALKTYHVRTLESSSSLTIADSAPGALRVFLARLSDDSNTTVAEHAISVGKDISSPEEGGAVAEVVVSRKVRTCFDADMEDFDSLLEDVTFRINSDYTALHTHHGNGEDTCVVLDAMGEAEKTFHVDCY